MLWQHKFEVDKCLLTHKNCVRDQNFLKGTHGFEPWTYRTAADCSTTELYPLHKTQEKICRVGPRAACIINDMKTEEHIYRVGPHSWFLYTLEKLYYVV